MLYGKIIYPSMITSSTICNLGDIAQSIALEYVYQRMGVSDSQIREIPIDELGTYKGDHVRLPINCFFLYNKKYPLFPLSKDIDPVFLSVYCTSPQYLRHKEYLGSQGTIGCRDEATMRAMRKYGYDAFLIGCLTMLFPKREKPPISPKVFCVDAHPSIIPYIPEPIKSNTVFLTHDIEVDPKEDKYKNAHRCEVLCRELFERYRDEAGLIITSRLHCAAPCIAMGIPTVVVKNGYDERFGFLDKFVHLYTPDEYNSIDWNPIPPEFEEFKEILMSWAVQRIQGENRKELAQQIEDFYMDRERKELSTPFFVRSYMKISQYFPEFANFMRDKVLHKYSITSNGNK